jgi:hypothetical protein
MPRLAFVVSFERSDEEGAKVALLKVDTGGDTITVYHHGDIGDDSQPLPNDTVVLDEAEENVVSYADTVNAGKAGPGDKRIYARKADGSMAVELWLKANGSTLLANENGRWELAANGDVTINGVVIKADGSVTTPKTIEASGEITAKAGGTESVTMTGHVHPTGVGPSGAATSGT